MINPQCKQTIDKFEVVMPQCGVEHGHIVANIFIAEKYYRSGLTRRIFADYRRVRFYEEMEFDHSSAQKINLDRAEGQKMSDLEYEVFIKKHRQLIESQAENLLYPAEISKLRR